MSAASANIIALSPETGQLGSVFSHPPAAHQGRRRTLDPWLTLAPTYWRSPKRQHWQDACRIFDQADIAAALFLDQKLELAYA